MRMRVLGRFAVDGAAGPIDVPAAGQRVLALLAVGGGMSDRHRLAGMVWPDRPEDRAVANLRGALWRLPDELHGSVEKVGDRIRLGPRWSVDLDDAVAAAARLRHGDLDNVLDVRRLLDADLLPDWDLECLVVARERHRQLRLHALEDLADLQLRSGRPLDAVDTALAAIAAEPLRETAQAMLFAAHLNAGNRAEAVRAYERFRCLLATELHVEPGPRLRAAVEAAGLKVTLR
jgi:DNA-binding SARP family transcriptional activator